MSQSRPGKTRIKLASMLGIRPEWIWENSHKRLDGGCARWGVTSPDKFLYKNMISDDTMRDCVKYGFIIEKDIHGEYCVIAKNSM
jgi:hypothetical protein